MTLNVAKPKNLEARLTKNAPKNIKASRIKKDVREISDTISQMSDFDTYRCGDLDSLGDLLFDLSYALRPYGLDIELNASVSFSKAKASDPWGSSALRQEWEDYERKLAADSKAARKAAISAASTAIPAE